MELGELARDLAVTVCRIVITALILIFQAITSTIYYAHSVYPQATTAVFITLGVYLTFRFVNKVIRMWLNFIISTIKTLFMITFLVMLLAIYLRGFHRFFTKDIYYLYGFFQSAAEENYDYQRTGYKYAANMIKDSKYDFVRKSLQAVFGTDDVTVEQLLEFIEEADNFIVDNAQGIKDFLGDLNNEAKANNFNNFFHNIGF